MRRVLLKCIHSCIYLRVLFAGSLPPFMLRGHARTVVSALVQCSRITPETVKWAECRSGALKALTNICLNMHLGKTGKPIPNREYYAQ